MKMGIQSWIVVEAIRQGYRHIDTAAVREKSQSFRRLGVVTVAS
ncbi:hypothetical protein ACRPK6_08345 [Exiguobacterium sp. TRN 1102]